MSDTKGSSADPPQHPLEHEWVLWIDDKSGAQSTPDDYGKGLKPLYTVKTVEEFWG